MKKNIISTNLIVFVLISALFIGCSSGEEEEDELQPFSTNKIYGKITNFVASSKKAIRPEDQDSEIINESTEIDKTINDIEKKIQSVNQFNHKKEIQAAIKEVKNRVEKYKQTGAAQDTQFALEFSKSVLQKNVDSMSDENVISTMDKIKNGFEKAQVILAKGLKFASKIGGIIIKIVEATTKNNPKVDQNALQAAGSFFGDDGHLNSISNVLQSLPSSNLRATPKKINPSISRPLTASSKEALEKDYVDQARQFITKVKNEVANDQTIKKLTNSSVLKKHDNILEIDLLADKIDQIKVKKKKEKSKKTKQVIQSSNLQHFNSCPKNKKFVFFCEEK